MADLVILSVNTGMRLGECRAVTNPLVELSDDCDGLYLPGEVSFNSEALAAYVRLKPIIDDAWSDRTFYWFWGRARRDIAKGDKNFVFYVCCQTAASRLSNNVSANEFEITDILRHADTRTTRRYVHTRQSNLLNAVRAL